MNAHRILLWFTALVLGQCGAAAADQLIVPQPADRGEQITAHYRLDRPARGQGQLDIEWTDAHGRLVDRRQVPAAFDDQIDMAFTLDLRRAAAMRNQLAARLTLNGAPAGEAQAEFIVRPTDRSFDDYQIVMWQQQSAAQWATLKRIGVTAGIVFGDRDGRGPSFTTKQIEPLLENDLRWYVENIATDFYAAYHRWIPGKPINWLFLEAQRRYAENPLDPSAVRREPGMADADALRRITDRLATTVRMHRRYAPLFYNLGDEAGIADLSAHWDFDFSPAALTAFRGYLKQRYGSLAALNATWDTSFPSWEAVVPRTTREAIHQGNENFAAWAEFKAWMDEAFAATVRAGAEAVRRTDAKALTAITGGQVPGWGGWNYAALAGTVSVMETGNDGRAFDIVRSLDPSLVLLTTLFSRGGGREEHRLWRQLLRGGRGAIIWDSRGEFVGPDGTLGRRGQDAARYFPALRGGLAALLIQSRAQTDAVALLHSQASFRTRWLLDRRSEGDTWSRRTAEDEHNDENDWRRSMVAHLDELRHLGLSPRILSSRQVETGELRDDGLRMLILPHAIALSASEEGAIRDFVEHGGIAVADTDPGGFDQLSRRLPASPLADLFTDAETAQGGRGWAAILPLQGPDRLEDALRRANLLPSLALALDDGTRPRDVEAYRFRNGEVTLLAIHADLPESRAPDDVRHIDSRPVHLTLPRRAHLYDLRQGIALGYADHITLALDPVKPIILALAGQPLPPPVLDLPARLRQGQSAVISIALGGATPAATHVYHVDVLDPAGKVVPHYSGNLIAPKGRASLTLPIALNDAPGQWEVRVTDRLSGAAVSARISVAPQ